MPRPHSSAVRQSVFRLARQKLSCRAIARRLLLPESTVRVLLRRGPAPDDASLVPDYQACGRHQAARLSPLLDSVLRLHAEHPRWGAGRLHVELADLFPDQTLSCPRTLQRWLRRQHIEPARPGRPPAAETTRSQQPHEVWQMDAVEQLPLATRQQVSWLRITDEASGAILQTEVFPPGALQSSAPEPGATAVAACLESLGTAADF